MLVRAGRRVSRESGGVIRPWLAPWFSASDSVRSGGGARVDAAGAAGSIRPGAGDGFLGGPTTGTIAGPILATTSPRSFWRSALEALERAIEPSATPTPGRQYRLRRCPTTTATGRTRCRRTPRTISSLICPIAKVGTSQMRGGRDHRRRTPRLKNRRAQGPLRQRLRRPRAGGRNDHKALDGAERTAVRPTDEQGRRAVAAAERQGPSALVVEEETKCRKDKSTYQHIAMLSPFVDAVAPRAREEHGSDEVMGRGGQPLLTGPAFRGSGGGPSEAVGPMNCPRKDGASMEMAQERWRSRRTPGVDRAPSAPRVLKNRKVDINEATGDNLRRTGSGGGTPPTWWRSRGCGETFQETRLHPRRRRRSWARTPTWPSRLTPQWLCRATSRSTTGLTTTGLGSSRMKRRTRLRRYSSGSSLSRLTSIPTDAPKMAWSS